MPRHTARGRRRANGGQRGQTIDRYDDVDVFIGLDVGKGENHAVALDRAGKQLFDRELPDDEARLQAVLAQLQQHRLVLLVVDQPATIGALPVAVAQAEGALVGYLPGHAMRRTICATPPRVSPSAQERTSRPCSGCSDMRRQR